MTVTTQLIGKLGGGGGAPEMQNQQVASTSFVRIPSGWGKAVGVFAGTATAASPTVFGTVFKGMSAGSFLNGGGRQPASLFRFSLRHDHVGAPGIAHKVVVANGCHHTTRRETRRGTGLGLGTEHQRNRTQANAVAGGSAFYGINLSDVERPKDQPYHQRSEVHRPQHGGQCVRFAAWRDRVRLPRLVRRVVVA